MLEIKVGQGNAETVEDKKLKFPKTNLGVVISLCASVFTSCTKADDNNSNPTTATPQNIVSPNTTIAGVLISPEATCSILNSNTSNFAMLIQDQEKNSFVINYRRTVNGTRSFDIKNGDGEPLALPGRSLTNEERAQLTDFLKTVLLETPSSPSPTDRTMSVQNLASIMLAGLGEEQQ